MIQFVICSILSFQIGQSNSKPPSSFIDIGNCPGEGCAYGKWKAQKAINLFASKTVKSYNVATLKSGEIVKALTGDVHTEAGIFILEKPFECYLQNKVAHSHHPGERIFVYTYEGEGFYKFWCHGRMASGFSPSIKSNFKPGQEHLANGHWYKEPKTIWWAKIQTTTGIIGWTPVTKPYAFDGTYEGDQNYIK